MYNQTALVDDISRFRTAKSKSWLSSFYFLAWHGVSREKFYSSVYEEGDLTFYVQLMDLNIITVLLLPMYAKALCMKPWTSNKQLGIFSVDL